MEVQSVCRLPVSHVVWQSRAQGWVLTVVAKATFDLLPTESRLSQHQEPIRGSEAFVDDDPSKSVYAPSDLALAKATCDVVLVGHAYAPGRIPARSVTARLLAGEVDKSIEVAADSVLTPDGAVCDGAGFAKMPLRYERAAGGPDTWNPIGIRSGRADAYGRTPLPNLLPPGADVTGSNEFIAPIGFGPIAPTWPMRWQKLGPRSSAWYLGGAVSAAVPDELDFAFFNVAPPDQRASAIRDNERLLLENLHPEHRRLITSLPGARPRLFVDRRGASPAAQRMTCDTLWIDTDRAICTLTWRLQVPIEGPAEPGRVIVAIEERGETVTWAHVAPILGARIPAELSPWTSLHKTGETQLFAASTPGASPAWLASGGGAVLDLRDAASPEVSPSFAMKDAVALSNPRWPDESAWARPEGNLAARVDWAAATPLPDTAALVARESGFQLTAQASSQRAVVDVLWIEPDAGARMSRVHGGEDGGRREVSDALRCAVALAPGAIAEAFDVATRQDFFEPPLLTATGEIELLFDEVERLRAMLDAVAPFADTDPSLREAVDLVDNAVRSGRCASASIAQRFASTLEQAFARAGTSLPASYLGDASERALLERRAFSRRTILGAPRVRARFHGAGDPVHVYLPEPLASRLPLFARLRAAVAVAVVPQQDPGDPGDLALIALAVGRILKGAGE